MISAEGFARPWQQQCRDSPFCAMRGRLVHRPWTLGLSRQAICKVPQRRLNLD